MKRELDTYLKWEQKDTYHSLLIWISFDTLHEIGKRWQCWKMFWPLREVDKGFIDQGSERKWPPSRSGFRRFCNVPISSSGQLITPLIERGSIGYLQPHTRNLNHYWSLWTRFGDFETARKWLYHVILYGQFWSIKWPLMLEIWALLIVDGINAGKNVFL